MNSTTNIKLFILGLACISSIGCDQLSESFTGQPDPNAPTLAPVGPSGANADKSRMVAMDSQPMALPSSDSTPSPFVTPANAQELSGSNVSQVVPTSGSSDGPSMFGATGNSGTTSTGLQVPAAENITPSSDGKIYITSAHLKFVNDLEVAAQADGLIVKMDADEGDLLTTDTLMIQLDDRLANSELDVTRKEYDAAVEKSTDDSEIQYSKASHEVAREEYKIALEIDQKGAGTATELSKKWLEYKRAELAITVAEFKNKQDLSAAGVAKSKTGAAEVQVQLRKIIAPFDGIVAEKRKERHDWVRAGDVILRLVSMEQLRVVGQVRVAQLSAAPHELLGAPANIDIELFPGRVERVAAKVGFVSPVMESSGGYKIWLQIPNLKSNNQWVFREGMPAKIEIQTR